MFLYWFPERLNHDVVLCFSCAMLQSNANFGACKDVVGNSVTKTQKNVTTKRLVSLIQSYFFFQLYDK